MKSRAEIERTKQKKKKGKKRKRKRKEEKKTRGKSHAFRSSFSSLVLLPLDFIQFLAVVFTEGKNPWSKNRTVGRSAARLRGHVG